MSYHGILLCTSVCYVYQQHKSDALNDAVVHLETDMHIHLTVGIYACAILLIYLLRNRCSTVTAGDISFTSTPGSLHIAIAASYTTISLL
jgi:hypothetical protein